MKIGLEYIKYRWKSKIHEKNQSDFKRDFFNKCLTISLDRNSKDELRTLFNKLKSDQRVIKIEDFGAGSKKLGESRKVSKILKTSSSKGKYGKLLYQLNRQFQFKNCLELGTSLGVGTCYLHLGNPKSSITTVEACTETREIALENFEGKENINCVHLKFENFLKNHEKGTYDFVYIDGHHDGNALLKYLKMLTPFTNKNTIFLLDDIRWSSSMKEAWQELVHGKQFEETIDMFKVGILHTKSN